MSRASIGERVGCISSGDSDTLKVLGYGVYESDEVPTEAVGDFADFMRGNGMKNPKIRLDSGKVVYGCECWWGPEEAVKARVAVYKNVVDVDIDELRRAYHEAEQKRQQANLEALDATGK